jgi:hypothetical protein
MTKRRTPNGWWNNRAAQRQNIVPTTPTRAPKAPQPAYVPKGPAPITDTAKEVLRLIRDRIVRAAGLAAYYWTDKFMQDVTWIERGLLRFLKARGMIHKTAGGVYKLTEIAMKLLAPVPAPSKRVLTVERNDSAVEAKHALLAAAARLA